MEKEAPSTSKESPSLREGHGRKSGDRMLAHAVRLSEPHQRFLGTDQRFTGQRDDGPLPVLPAAVEVRTPPPGSPAIPTRVAPSCLVSRKSRPREVGQSTKVIETQKASIQTSSLRALMAALDGIPFETRECLGLLPWNIWLNSSRCMAHKP